MRTTTTILAGFCLAMSLHASNALLQTPVEDIDGHSTTLAPYEGKVLLIVNVASHCGFTPQYAGLEALYTKYHDEGLVVLGFPCNQFGDQEPGSAADIKSFCTANYGVTFPMFAKLEVNGPQRHPLYTALAGPASPFPGDIGWNFTKFLVGRDGTVRARFASDVAPDSPELLRAIESALGAKR